MLYVDAVAMDGSHGPVGSHEHQQRGKEALDHHPLDDLSNFVTFSHLT